MINKITISGVASYKNEATLETDKNINPKIRNYHPIHD